MDKEIFEILQRGWKYEFEGTKTYDRLGPIKTEEEAIEYLRELDGHEQERSSRRWWDDLTVVAEVQVNDDDVYYIGYRDAETTGDRSAYDRGWEFDPESIRLYEKQTKTITYFELKQ